MENVTGELAYLKLFTNTSRHVCLVFGITDTQELTQGTDMCTAQLHLVELIAGISKILGYKKSTEWKVGIF